MDTEDKVKESYHVVVTDDDVVSRKTAELILKRQGIRVTTLHGGRELLSHIKREGAPDLILLDIVMPKPDGFETLAELRDYEREQGLPETAVVFFSGAQDKEAESKGLALGALDFIRKPFRSEVLIRRVKNILENGRLLRTLSEEASTDTLTGLWNKVNVNHQLELLCRESAGTLLIIDLDSFKLVNDLYGHDMGDRLLTTFAEILRKRFRDSDVVGRIGGDEFIAFLRNTVDEDGIRKVTARLNEELQESTKKLLGEDMTIPIGVSAGAAISESGGTYEDLFRKADIALRHVKQNGKHSCQIYHDIGDGKTVLEFEKGALTRLNQILNERNAGTHALWTGQEAFGNIYRYMLRYIKRYREKAVKLLFTVLPEPEDLEEAEFEAVLSELGECFRSTLRNSDIMMRSAHNCFFLLLPMVSEQDIDKVIRRMLRSWEKTGLSGKTRIYYETEAILPDQKEELHVRNDAPRVVVAETTGDYESAASILRNAGMEVTEVETAVDLLELIGDGERPELLLLDTRLPDMDGFEVLLKLRAEERSGEETPVIFLTESNDKESEERGLAIGGMDFIRRPYMPEILTIRVRRSIELIRLQQNLSAAVEKKTGENEQLFLQVVQTLAGAIDAKDTYTNGHSRRVAEYAREIARRWGYQEDEQRDIFIMGLLHDVGKIGVPDEVINKPSRLTSEEFALIRNHPVMGAAILSNIKIMPKLSSAARWHHERYGGGGYPDGICRDEIPEEARIIAVADAYDAMTSDRSYRKALSQEEVRSEIVKGSGTQFDPAFADIMLSMMDEDKEFRMREHPEG